MYTCEYLDRFSNFELNCHHFLFFFLKNVLNRIMEFILIEYSKLRSCKCQFCVKCDFVSSYNKVNIVSHLQRLLKAVVPVFYKVNRNDRGLKAAQLTK